MGAVIDLWKKINIKNNPNISYELDEIIYSKKHGHEICVLRLIGKNIFPIMTTNDILSNSDAMNGLSHEDIIKITRLDMEIKYQKDKLKAIEFDRNGTVLFENHCSERIRYSEKIILTNQNIHDKLNGKDALRIGYNAGFKDGTKISKEKKKFMKKFFNILKLDIKV